MARKRVQSIRIDPTGDKVKVIAIGSNSRGSRYGHTVREIPKQANGRPFNLVDLESVIREVLGEDPIT